MERIVFYSWQSESPSKVCRNFIQASLEKALKRLGRDNTAEISPVLDRDAGGVPGTPSISNEIFSKIVFCDVFVADVTLSRRSAEWKIFGFTLTHRSKVRRSPNPNVLIELGFAVAHVGWEKIVLVQNTEFGGPDELPFDLRGRRTVTYQLSSDDTNDKAGKREDLARQLELALRSCLLPLDEDCQKPSRWEPRWWGFWNERSDNGAYGGSLLISETSSRGFTFHLQVYRGSHLGQITGFAEIANMYTAQANIANPSSVDLCRLRFRRSEETPALLTIDETGSCQYFRGIGARFAGSFVRQQENLFDFGFMSELELQRLFTITGQYYEPLMLRFGGTGKQDWLDTEIQGEAFFGLVSGLATIMEAIVMKGTRGELWAAYIDDDRVRYFTTQKEYKGRTPETIAKWRSNFQDKPVVFMHDVNTIPNEFGSLDDSKISADTDD